MEISKNLEKSKLQSLWSKQKKYLDSLMETVKSNVQKEGLRNLNAHKEALLA